MSITKHSNDQQQTSLLARLIYNNITITVRVTDITRWVGVTIQDINVNGNNFYEYHAISTFLTCYNVFMRHYKHKLHKNALHITTMSSIVNTGHYVFITVARSCGNK